jgi:hypothetical protein
MPVHRHRAAHPISVQPQIEFNRAASLRAAQLRAA